MHRVNHTKEEGRLISIIINQYRLLSIAIDGTHGNAFKLTVIIVHRSLCKVPGTRDFCPILVNVGYFQQILKQNPLKQNPTQYKNLVKIRLTAADLLHVGSRPDTEIHKCLSELCERR